MDRPERSHATRSTTVLGRRAGSVPDGESDLRGELGAYRATDGSDGADVAIDFDRPHACLLVGKRGSGKSHTLGVVAEELAGTGGVAPVVFDPMGEFGELSELGLERLDEPRVRAGSIPPETWPALVGLDPAGPAGTLVWQAADEAGSLAAMRERVAEADATATARRGARNHLRLAAAWDVFDSAASHPSTLVTGRGTVVDLSGLAGPPANAVCRALVDGLYRWQTAGRDERAGATDEDAADPLPWVLLDEAHAFFDGITEPALRRVLTRGRTPGVSLVAATQRPGALPSVATSQADLLVAHRLTAEPDVTALEAATPTYLEGRLRERLPRERGCAVVVDDATESVHGVRVRDRRTSHGGASPRASDRDNPHSQTDRSRETETTDSVGSD